MRLWPQRQQHPDPLACPKGRHVYEVPSVYPPGPPMPGTPGIVSVRDCHCPAASPGHIHWTKV